MVSVIIPAHNEARSINRCLTALTRGAKDGELEVIVVCNGCTDETAEQARNFGGPVRVVETDQPSKSNALNLGDRLATRFPRFYVDADTVLPLESLRAVVAKLASKTVLAAAPRIKFDVDGRPFTVRAFYTIWQRLPYCRTGMIGSGVYALSQRGRERFDEFPTITADDAFVRSHFAPEERATADECSFTVSTPHTLASLIAIKTRAHFGNRELRLTCNDASAGKSHSPSGHGKALLKIAANPLRWGALGVYMYVRVASRLLAAKRLRAKDYDRWERDETSRRHTLVSEEVFQTANT